MIIVPLPLKHHKIASTHNLSSSVISPEHHKSTICDDHALLRPPHAALTHIREAINAPPFHSQSSSKDVRGQYD